MNEKKLPPTVCYDQLFYEAKFFSSSINNYKNEFEIQIFGNTNLKGQDYWIFPPDKELSQKNLFLNIKTQFNLTFKENHISMISFFSGDDFEEVCKKFKEKHHYNKISVSRATLHNQSNSLEEIYLKIVNQVKGALEKKIHDMHMKNTFSREFVCLNEKYLQIIKQFEQLPQDFKKQFGLYSVVHNGLGIDRPISWTYSPNYEYSLCSPETVLKIKLNKNLQENLPLKKDILKVKI